MRRARSSPGPNTREGDTLSPTRPDGADRRSTLWSRARFALLGGVVLLSTTACSVDSSDLPRFGWPTAAADQTERSLWLWQTLWIVAIFVFVITFVLILW